MDPDFLRFAFPVWWHEAQRGPDGRWPLQMVHEGGPAIDLGEREGRPSRWNTLRALRVLDWYRAG